MSISPTAEKFETLVLMFMKMESESNIYSEEFIHTQALSAKDFYETKYKVDLPAEIFKTVIRKLHSNFNVSMDKGVAIVDKDTPHQSWLPHRRAEMDFFFWNRFKQYLEIEKKWNNQMIASLDDITDDIIDLLGDPKSNTHWKRRGLILGDVQSGKTINYTAIANKAVDADYRVIILLTGTLENLRKQTQERLDSDFVGRDSKAILTREARNISIGVGKYGQRKTVTTFTSINYDFNSNMLNSLGYNLKNNNDAALFVVKKNKKILQNLDTWLKVHNANDKGEINLPMLLIDDEADNASVNTRGDDDPTAINEAIRQLLKRFTKSTYLGVTATPFANIFINPDTDDEMVGDDLFPSDFIYSLSPPSNYIGNNALFGEDAKYDDRLEKIDDEVLPEKHNKNTQISELPLSMMDSLGYFLLVNAIRDYRGDTNSHRSMLVNVSQLTAIQDQFSNKISEWLRDMRTDIQNYSKLSPEKALQSESIKFLFDIWEKYNLAKTTGVSWKTIQTKYLYSAVSPIEIRSVNQRTGSSSLNYNIHQEFGLRVIAVGGYSLSRGLTLEGLVVSYFYRNSKMYDTLMQMGRWFGYRPGYEDLFRIWMKSEAINWYQSITAATNELREEIKKMKRRDKTPREFGLKVRYDPEALLVTARNKMKHTKTVECLIAVSGRLLETPRLPKNELALTSNYNAVTELISKLEFSIRDQKVKDNFWRDLPKKYVVELLNNFTVDPTDLKFSLNRLPDYIEDSNHLNKWDVYIPSGDGGLLEPSIDNIEINMRQRKVMIEGTAILVSEKKVRVGTGGDTKIGLTIEQLKDIKQRFMEDNLDKGKENPSDNYYLIPGRNPLLILHFIDPKQDGATYKTSVPMVAIGLGFPDFAERINDKLVKYVLNPVEVKNRLMFEEDDEYADD